MLSFLLTLSNNLDVFFVKHCVFLHLCDAKCTKHFSLLFEYEVNFIISPWDCCKEKDATTVYNIKCICDILLLSKLATVFWRANIFFLFLLLLCRMCWHCCCSQLSVILYCVFRFACNLSSYWVFFYLLFVDFDNNQLKIKRLKCRRHWIYVKSILAPETSTNCWIWPKMRSKKMVSFALWNDVFFFFFILMNAFYFVGSMRRIRYFGRLFEFDNNMTLTIVL